MSFTTAVIVVIAKKAYNNYYRYGNPYPIPTSAEDTSAV